MDLKKELNPEQYEAATNVASHTRIIAGAGSGKTRVLTYRIAYLINEVGIDPKKILAITFTNKAANEMKSRVEKMMGQESLGVTICTIHSLCVRVLREHIHLLGYPRYFVILDTEDQKSVLKDIYSKLGIDVKAFSYSSVLSTISYFKYSRISVEQAYEMAGDFRGEKIKAKIYEMYLDYQAKQLCLDFDDLLLKTVEIFERFPLALEIWQRKFQYIHVDEFQDVGEIEYQIVKDLTGKNNFVCVVGDPDQTIYSFRGANVQFIIDFDKDFENCKTVILNQNYRSSQNILDCANTLIRHNKNRLEKDLYTRLPKGSEVVHYSGQGPEQEAEFVVNEINHLIETVDGINYHDFLILYRANYLSRTIEQALMRNKMDYRIFGGLRFTDRKEVKDVLCYLRAMVFHDDLAFNRIINVPSRSIGKKTMDKITEYCSERGISIYDGLKEHCDHMGLSSKVKKKLKELIMLLDETKQNIDYGQMNIVEGYDYLLNESGYMEMLKVDEEESRIENVLEIKNMMNDFLNRYEGDNVLEEFLQELPLSNVENNDDHGEYISLMTIHMSKGLEYRYVFVIGLSDDVFPSFRSISESGDEGLEEERRLAYVAFTRAKEKLYLCDSQGYSFVTNSPKITSRFVDEIGSDSVVHQGVKPRYKTADYIIDPESTMEARIGNNEIDDMEVGDKINHQMFGDGIVTKVDGMMIEVAFQYPYGVKTLIKNHKAITRIEKNRIIN